MTFYFRIPERIKRGKLISFRRSTESYDLALVDGRVRICFEPEVDNISN
ncbi:MAG: hypothetical protein ACTS42_00080 [Candidatus Hodgkinia cicadicola]